MQSRAEGVCPVGSLETLEFYLVHLFRATHSLPQSLLNSKYLLCMLCTGHGPSCKDKERVMTCLPSKSF